MSEPDASNLAASSLETLAVTVQKGCELVGIRPTKMYELIDMGAVESFKIGNRRLLKYASLKKLVEAAQ
jgi:excisionase family DNA binding protein